MDFWFEGFFNWKNLKPTVLRLLMGRYFKQSCSWAVQGLGCWVGAAFQVKQLDAHYCVLQVCVSNIRLLHFLEISSLVSKLTSYLIILIQTNTPNPVNHRLPFEISQSQVVQGLFSCLVWRISAIPLKQRFFGQSDSWKKRPFVCHVIRTALWLGSPRVSQHVRI